MKLSHYQKNSDGSFEIKGFKSDPDNHEQDLKILKALGISGYSASTIPEPTQAKKSGIRFSELADKYINFAKVSPKPEAQDKAIFQLFIEWRTQGTSATAIEVNCCHGKTLSPLNV